MTDTPTAYSYQYTWPTPTTTKVPDILRKMETIALAMMDCGAMNLGLSLRSQIAELREILGAVE